MNAIQAAILNLKAYMQCLIRKYATEEEETLSRRWQTPDGLVIFDLPVTRNEAAEAFDLDPEDLTPAKN